MSPRKRRLSNAALVTQASFCEGSSGDLAKRRLFSQATFMNNWSTNTDIEWQAVEASNVPVVAEGKHLEFLSFFKSTGKIQAFARLMNHETIQDKTQGNAGKVFQANFSQNSFEYEFPILGYSILYN